MSIKIKKIELTKMLIGSSLLLSAIGLPLALTSCSKKSGIDGDDKKGKEDKEQKYHYLFKLEPELFDKENKKNISKDKFIAENSVKSLLDAKNGYDKDFFSKLDKSFGEKAVFYEKDGNKESENDNDKYKKVDDLGETVVYYLNTNDISKTDQHVSFAINEEVFGKINKIDEIKKYISYAQIVDMKDFNVGTEKVEDGLVLEKNDSDASFVKFYKEDETTNQFVEEKEDVKKIKKVKIVLDQTIENKSLGSDGKVGFLVTFTPIDSNVKRTIIFKYANDKDCNFFKNNFYEDFEKSVKEIIDNDCAVISDDGFVNYVNKKIDEIKSSSNSSPIENLDKFAEESKNNQKTEWKIKNVDSLDLDALNALNEFLKNNLKITLDIKKCEHFKTYCFDYSALAKKDEDGNDFKYSFLISDDSKDSRSDAMKKNKNENGIDFKISTTKNDGIQGERTFYLPLDNFGEANEIVVKLAFKYNGIDFYSKDIVVKSKNNN